MAMNPSSLPFALPDVTGLTVEEAQAELSKVGITIDPVIGTEESADVEEGQIIRSDPPAGSQVQNGDVIRIVLSGGPNDVSVPTVTGLLQDSAKQLLEREEFGFIVSIVEEKSDTIAAGTSIRTDPPANQVVKKGSAIILYVSSGPEQQRVPALVGLTEAQARQLLDSAGFVVDVKYEPVPFGSATVGKVLSQTIPSGLLADPGTVVTIKVGEELPPPTTTSTTTTTTTTVAPCGGGGPP